MVNKMKADKRKYPRLRVYHLVKYLLISEPQSVKELAMLRDISGGGGLLLSEKKLSIGSMIQVFINFPHLKEPVSGLAKVAWVRYLSKSKKYESGLQFFELNEDTRNEIIKSIERVITINKKT